MSLGDELNIDTANKLHNGVDLMNRAELSPSQNRELQRFIDANKHLLQYSDRELPPEPPTRLASSSNYTELSKKIGQGAHPNQGAKSRGGDEYTVPDQWANRVIDGARGSMTNRHHSRSASPEKRVNGMNLPPGGEWMSHTFPRSVDDNYTHYGSMGGRNQLSSPNADTLKRKGVSWSDLVGGGGLELANRDNHRVDSSRRSHSPDQGYDRHRDSKMSQYGSMGSVSREYNMSPAYTSMNKPRDNYNRFETEQHARAKKLAQEEDAGSKFSGFGDRPGSGVELSKHTWAGGEIISDPSRLPAGPKPRRMYYSPIGDGTVAADGIELKRLPVDLTPRVTVTQLTHVDRGRPGRDGLNEYIKEWNTAGAAPASEYGGLDNLGGGPGSGRGLGAMSPNSGRGGPLDGANNNNNANNNGAPNNAGKDPYGTMSSRGTPHDYGLGGDRGNRGSPFDRGDHGHPDGRMSNASTMFSDPGYRYTDIQHGYAITNPRELIHQYATTTPIAVMEAADNTPGTMTTATYKKKVTTRIEERQGGNVQGDTYAPYPPYRASSQTVAESRTLSPTNFVRRLRDDTMTSTQREANTHMDQMNNKDPNQQSRIHEIRQKTTTGRSHNDDIDSLTNKMMEGLRNCPTPSRY
ncbi:hypothetical protein PENTCL1PPCAC_29336 [Pristionchus entomophagus]|uniref:Uncharacterized protein n=1 Tax=Pristionchus entomophagus TaxID=358040 RepID=A0AAV5UJN3_9BILA|nr:hypothetical protein PENTCL1PPCAC_29336 [Pristionchus entomophagus]